MLVVRSARRAYMGLPADAKREILKAVKGLAKDAHPPGSKVLSAKWAGFVRLSVIVHSVHYRVVYSISGQQITVHLVGTRENLYDAKVPKKAMRKVADLADDLFRHVQGRSCWEYAARHAVESGGTLVHGSVRDPERPVPRMDHAWVRNEDGSVYEPSTDIVRSAEEWAALDPVEYRTYSPAEVAERLRAEISFGPWRDRRAMRKAAGATLYRGLRLPTMPPDPPSDADVLGALRPNTHVPPPGYDKMAWPLYGQHWTTDARTARDFALDMGDNMGRSQRLRTTQPIYGVVLEARTLINAQMSEADSGYGEREVFFPHRDKVTEVIAHLHRLAPWSEDMLLRDNRARRDNTFVRSITVPPSQWRTAKVADLGGYSGIEIRGDEALLWRGMGEWGPDRFTRFEDGVAQYEPYVSGNDLIDDIEAEYGGLGPWWANEAVAKAYGDAGDSGAAIAVWWPISVLTDAQETTSGANEGLLVPSGTQGRLEAVHVRSAGAWKPLPIRSAMAVTANTSLV